LLKPLLVRVNCIYNPVKSNDYDIILLSIEYISPRFFSNDISESFPQFYKNEIIYSTGLSLNFEYISSRVIIIYKLFSLEIPFIQAIFPK